MTTCKSTSPNPRRQFAACLVSSFLLGVVGTLYTFFVWALHKDPGDQSWRTVAPDLPAEVEASFMAIPYFPSNAGPGGLAQVHSALLRAAFPDYVFIRRIEFHRQQGAFGEHASLHALPRRGGKTWELRPQHWETLFQFLSAARIRIRNEREAEQCRRLLQELTQVVPCRSRQWIPNHCEKVARCVWRIGETDDVSGTALDVIVDSDDIVISGQRMRRD